LSSYPLLLPLLLERVGVRLLKNFVRKSFMGKSKKHLHTKARSTLSCSKKYAASPSPFGEGRGEAALFLLLPLLLERVGVRLLKNFVKKSFMKKAKRIYTLRNRFVEIRENYMPPFFIKFVKKKIVYL
jgi:hypothetical protein